MQLQETTHQGNIQQLRIDIGTLKDFGTFLRRQLDDSLAPMASRVNHALAAGGDIGPNMPSDDLQMMNVQHAECVAAMNDQLEALKIGMAIIADAAHAIAARYSTSDTLAHTTVRNIAPALNAAVTHDTPPAGLL